MIGSLRGEIAEVEALGESAVELVVDVGGVGYRVSVTSRHAQAIATIGHSVRLSVHTHVREGAIQLFGFPDADERRTFELLLGAHGVGPSLALAILGILPPAALVRAVADEDLAALTQVPGVGKKTAERLQVELAQRLELFPFVAGPAPSLGGVGTGPHGEVREALMALGYGPAEVRAALDTLPVDGDVELLLREALAALAPVR